MEGHDDTTDGLDRTRDGRAHPNLDQRTETFGRRETGTGRRENGDREAAAGHDRNGGFAAERLLGGEEDPHTHARVPRLSTVGPRERRKQLDQEWAPREGRGQRQSLAIERPAQR